MTAPRVLRTRSGTLQYTLAGSGQPAIVLLGGAGMTLASWRALYPAIERLGTVLAWNRFGVEGSDPPAAPQSGTRVVAAMRELLVHAGLEPPYVIVAHSLGGLHANLFARVHPHEVAALMLLEATHPADHGTLQQHEAAITRALARVQGLPKEFFADNLHAELESVGDTVAAIEAAGPFPEIPVTVVTGALDPPKRLVPSEARYARCEHQRDLAALSPLGEQVMAMGSGHFPQLSEPAVVIGALRRLVAATRAYALA